MTKDCWFKDTSKDRTPNSKGKKGNGKGKGKNSVIEVTTPTESTVTPVRVNFHQSDLANHTG